MSVFLMGCYDPDNDRFCTVTKVHTGHDDKTLEKLQTELEMIKISADQTLVPDWLNVTKTMIPDFVAKDPRRQPVWEITGAEFTQHEVHTADGISIRFPRVTKIRDDKTWETATNLQELQELYRKSKENTDFSLLMKDDGPGSSNVKDAKQTNLLNFANGFKSPKRHRSPSDSPKPKKKKREKNAVNPVSKIKGLLPDYFESVKLLLDENAAEKYADWLRYFVAYGGTILENDEWKEATHVLHSTGSVSQTSFKCPNSVRHVVGEWLRDSIANKKVLDFHPYCVFWENKADDS